MDDHPGKKDVMALAEMEELHVFEDNFDDFIYIIYEDKIFGYPNCLDRLTLKEELFLQLRSDGLIKFSYWDFGFLHCFRNKDTGKYGSLIKGRILSFVLFGVFCNPDGLNLADTSEVALACECKLMVDHAVRSCSM